MLLFQKEMPVSNRCKTDPQRKHRKVKEDKETSGILRELRGDPTSNPGFLMHEHLKLSPVQMM